MRIGLLGSKGTTLDLLRGLGERAGRPIHQVLSLPPSLGAEKGVAYYRGEAIEAYCEARGIPFANVNSYELATDADRELFDEADLDLLLVIGWERIVPDAILDRLGRFACGMHGSPYGLPRGRGRSPLNWSLIQGHTQFTTCLFRYSSDVDAGDVIGCRSFEITSYDDIGSLHAKNRIVMQQLVDTYWESIESGDVSFSPQSPRKPTYYPRRKPEDSGIDWSWNTLALYNLIRAVTKPYPPAFAFLDGRKVYFLECRPFDRVLFDSGTAPGTVVDVSPSLEHFVVKTKDGSLEIRAFEGTSVEELSVGDRFTGIDQDRVLREIRTRYHEGIDEESREV